jgi:hypothetical protein
VDVNGESSRVNFHAGNTADIADRDCDCRDVVSSNQSDPVPPEKRCTDRQQVVR